MSGKSGKSKEALKSPTKGKTIAKPSTRPSVERTTGTNVPKDRNYFLKYPQSVWYEQGAELPALDSNEPLKDENKILKLKEEAKQLYEKYSAEYEESTYSCNSFAPNQPDISPWKSV